MLMKSVTLTLAGAVVAAMSISAGPLDNVRNIFGDKLKEAYYNTVKLLEDQKTDAGKEAADKLKEIMNNFDSEWGLVSNALGELDSKLKSRWESISKLENIFMKSAAALKQTVGRERYDDALKTLKSSWDEFSNDFNRVWGEFGAYGKRFHSMCEYCR